MLPAPLAVFSFHFNVADFSFIHSFSKVLRASCTPDHDQLEHLLIALVAFSTLLDLSPMLRMPHFFPVS
jgi:hypothetical protein